MPDDFVFVRNPDPDSSLPYLLRIPLPDRPASRTWRSSSTCTSAVPGSSATSTAVPLEAGDYGVAAEGRLVAVVERKSAEDLVTSLTTGKLRYQLTDLATARAAYRTAHGR